MAANRDVRTAAAAAALAGRRARPRLLEHTIVLRSLGPGLDASEEATEKGRQGAGVGDGNGCLGQYKCVRAGWIMDMGLCRAMACAYRYRQDRYSAVDLNGSLGARCRRERHLGRSRDARCTGVLPLPARFT